MPIDYSKGRYRVERENGELIGTIIFEKCVRLNGEVVYKFDETGCLYDTDNEYVGRVGDGVFWTLGGNILYRINPI